MIRIPLKDLRHVFLAIPPHRQVCDFLVLLPHRFGLVRDESLLLRTLDDWRRKGATSWAGSGYATSMDKILGICREVMGESRSCSNYCTCIYVIFQLNWYHVVSLLKLHDSYSRAICKWSPFFHSSCSHWGTWSRPFFLGSQSLRNFAFTALAAWDWMKGGKDWPSRFLLRRNGICIIMLHCVIMYLQNTFWHVWDKFLFCLYLRCQAMHPALPLGTHHWNHHHQGL